MQLENVAPMGGHLGGPTIGRAESLRNSGSAQMMSSDSGGERGKIIMNKASDVFPDLHHKMSKKIAQLTKVIYHLNTKNEDRQFELEEVNTNHQKEMQDILSDAANKIKHFQEELVTKQGQVNAEAQLEKLRAVHLSEKKEAMAEFRAFKRMVKEREESTQVECKDRVVELAAQVAREKLAFQQSLSRFQEKGKALKAALDAARASAAKDTRALMERHQVEVEDAIRKGNDKFNKMITEQMQAREDLQRSGENKAKEIQRNLEQAAGRLRAELAGDKEAALLALRRENDGQLQAVRISCSEKVERALADAARSRANTQEEEKRQKALATERERLVGEVSKLQENAAAMLETFKFEEASLRRLLETAAAEGRRLVKDLRSAEEARDEALAMGKGIGGEAKGLRERLKQELDEKEAFQRGVSAELASKDADLASRLGEIESLRHKMQTAVQEELEGRKELERKLKEAHGTSQDAFARLKEITESSRVAAEQSERERINSNRSASDLRLQLEATKKEAEARLIGIETRLTGELQDARRAAAATAAKASKALQEFREVSAGGTRELSERAKNREEELLRQLEEDQKKFEGELKRERAARARELEETAAAMEVVRAQSALEISELKRRLAEGEEQSGREGARRQAELEALKEELQRGRQAFVLEQETAERRRGDLDRLTEELEAARSDLHETGQATQQRLGKERAAAKAEVRALEDRAVRETAEQLERANASAAAVLEAELGRVSRELKAKHEAELSAIVLAEKEAADARYKLAVREAGESARQHDNQMEMERRDLIKAHAQRLREMETKNSSELSAVKATAQAEHEAEAKRSRGELQDSAVRSARELQGVRAALARDKEKAIEAAVSTAVLKRTSELNIAREKAMAALGTKLEGERDAEHAALGKTRNELRAKENELERALLECETARCDAEDLSRAAEAEARQQRAATEAREAALVSKHAAEMSHAVGRQRSELREAESQFKEKEQSLTFRIDALQEEQQRLQHRYTHRPSREEDIERITSLEEAAVEQENLVARTLEEMAFFKRELLNREENYNKKFNASPIVGVMQVVKSKDMRAGTLGGVGGKSIGGSDSRASQPHQGLSSTETTQQPVRPPRYNKTSRSSSLPSGYPSSGTGGVRVGANSNSGRKNGGSATSTRSHGSSQGSSSSFSSRDVGRGGVGSIASHRFR